MFVCQNIRSSGGNIELEKQAQHPTSCSFVSVKFLHLKYMYIYSYTKEVGKQIQLSLKEKKQQQPKEKKQTTEKTLYLQLKENEFLI